MKMHGLCCKLKASASALVILAGLTAGALAEDNDETGPSSDRVYRDMTVELGVGIVTDDSFKFGEYTGLEDDGVFAIGNFDLVYRDLSATGNGTYWSVSGHDLGLKSRDIYAAYGQQGRFGVEAFYDEIPHFLFDDAITPFRGNGTGRLRLPGTWVPATSAEGLTELDASNRPLELKIERTKYGARFNVAIDEEWTLHLGAQREEKEGLDRTWGIFGTNGGNPSGSVLAEPVDWRTTRVEGGIGYATDELQAALVYEASIFENRIESLIWTNPFSDQASGAPWSPAVGFPEPGRLALDPDNQAHSLTFTSAYRVSPFTRLSGQFRYINSRQDETFLPYTVNTGLIVPEALPRSSAEAEIVNIRGDVKLISRVSDKTTLRLSYTYDDRDNNTPRDLFLLVPNDTADQGTAGSGLARINLPYSFRDHDIEAQASYAAARWLMLHGTYSFEAKERTFQDVTDTSEHKGEIKANLRPGGKVRGRMTGWVKASYASRTNDGRQANRAFVSSHTQAFLAGNTPRAPFTEPFENHPELQPYNTAARDQVAVEASLSAVPSNTTSLTFIAKWKDEEYDDSEPFILSTLGLRDQSGLDLSVDGSVSIGRKAHLFANYTYQKLDRRVINHQSQSFGSLIDLTQPSQRWRQDVKDETHTVSTGFNWSSKDDTFAVKSSYSYYLADTSWDIAAGSELSFEPYPVVESRRHRFDLQADVRLLDDLTARVLYIYEDFESADWAYDGISQASIGRILTTGHQPFDYSVHVIGVSTVTKF